MKSAKKVRVPRNKKITPKRKKMRSKPRKQSKKRKHRGGLSNYKSNFDYFQENPNAAGFLGKKFMNLPNVKLNPCNLYYPNLGPQGYITESDCRRLTEGKGLFFEKTTLDGEKVGDCDCNPLTKPRRVGN